MKHIFQKQTLAPPDRRLPTVVGGSLAFFLLFTSVLYPAPVRSTFLEKEPSDPVLRHERNWKKEQGAEGQLSHTEWLVCFRQQILSPTDGPRSHFYPTSSEYMKQAVAQHGFVGYLLGMGRLLRENADPWHYPLVQVGFSTRKYDPVPGKLVPGEPGESVSSENSSKLSP